MPRIMLPAEPDAFLGIFLSLSSMTRVSPSEDYDFAVYPRLVRDIRSNYLCKLDQYGDLAARPGDRPLIVFAQNDYEGLIECRAAPTLVYRTGLSRHWRMPNEFTLPFLWILHPEGFSARPRGEKPVIGFCGTLKGRRLRRRTLAYFAEHPAFACNYLIRERFWAEGIPVDQARSEYEQNIDASDFVICDRGIGNWTVRMYEVLSRGRIPIFLDTHGVLPAIRSGRWQDTIITAPTRRRLADKVLDVWRNDDLTARQHRCRALWLDNFSMAGFAANLSTHLARLAEDPAYRERTFKTGPVTAAKATVRRALHRWAR